MMIWCMTKKKSFSTDVSYLVFFTPTLVMRVGDIDIRTIT